MPNANEIRHDEQSKQIPQRRMSERINRQLEGATGAACERSQHRFGTVLLKEIHVGGSIGNGLVVQSQKAIRKDDPVAARGPTGRAELADDIIRLDQHAQEGRAIPFRGPEGGQDQHQQGHARQQKGRNMIQPFNFKLV
jgi:hypothetical protein